MTTRDHPDLIEAVIRTVLARYPGTQAVYLFGSWGTGDEWPESDVDIAVLLPPGDSKRAHDMAISEARLDLERLLGKDVDLINLREATTVFQKEIVMADRRIWCADVDDADEFEIRVISAYQKLNEERAEILSDGMRTGRFYDI